jgi:hypothetical protein
MHTRKYRYAWPPALNVIAFSLLVGPAPRADTVAPEAAILACRQIGEPARRLDCYDRIGRADETPGKGATGGAARSEPAPLHQKVVAATYAPDGRLTVTLDNGQTWRQVDTDRTDVRPGDEVTIRPGLLGSYLLTGDRDGRAVRVRWAR